GGVGTASPTANLVMSLGRPSYEQLAALVVEQAATIQRLEGRVVELEAELAELKRRLAQSSRRGRRPRTGGPSRRPRRTCCGQRTAAGFPAGVAAPTQYGPRVRALAMYLIARQHLPYERTAELFADWLGAPISSGTLARYVAAGAADLQGFLDEVQRQIIGA